MQGRGRGKRCRVGPSCGRCVRIGGSRTVPPKSHVATRRHRHVSPGCAGRPVRRSARRVQPVAQDARVDRGQRHLRRGAQPAAVQVRQAEYGRIPQYHSCPVFPPVCQACAYASPVQPGESGCSGKLGRRANSSPRNASYPCAPPVHITPGMLPLCRTTPRESAWWQWDEGLRLRQPEALKAFVEEHKEALEEFIAIQFMFERQWMAIKVGGRAGWRGAGRGARSAATRPGLTSRDAVSLGRVIPAHGGPLRGYLAAQGLRSWCRGCMSLTKPHHQWPVVSTPYILNRLPP